MEMVRISFSLSPRTVGNRIPEIGWEVKVFLGKYLNHEGHEVEKKGQRHIGTKQKTKNSPRRHKENKEAQEEIQKDN